ncbi:hypothetical protein EYR40_009510 [Pleurotus pulmonarius]|nr:hypothetical protein EYR38_009387 [Pleurotus pulmonarius]KAF4590913.1 hypothetical protein EYR40_009510 [Pleurotus pulmonarius]
MAGSLSSSELERTFGVFFIGYVAAMVGYGFTFFQTYVYYSRYPKDHWAIKLTVTALSLLDTAASALISQALYFYLVNLFPYESGLDNATHTFSTEIALAVIAKWIVQMFYAHRLWTISTSVQRLGPALIALMSTAALALGLVMAAELINNPRIAHLADEGPHAVVASCQALTFVASLLTFVLLCYHLRPSQTANMKPIEGWFDNMVAYIISRGSAGTLVQLGFFITFLIAPANLYWIPFHFVASKLFINGLLTMLNCREVVRGRGVNEEETVDSKKGSGFTGSSGEARSNGAVRFNIDDHKISQPAINIEVSRTVQQTDGQNKILYDLADNGSLSDGTPGKPEKAYAV